MSDSVLLSDDHPVDPDDELLVAFLDDELDDNQRQKVEQRLLDDASFATRLRSLQSGWDFLDDLPDVAGNEKLVESTLEMVVSEIAPAQVLKQSPMRRYRTAIIVATVSLIGFVGGALVVAALYRADRQGQLKDLAIAEDLDAYLLGDDFDFFRELDANSEWRAMLDAQEAGGMTMVTPSVIKGVALEDRAEFLHELPLDERGRLNLKWQHFSTRDETVKQELRRTYESVHRQPDSERLLKTMKAFWAWRDTLDDKTKDGLVSDDRTVRRQAFEEAIRRSRERLTRRSGSVISDEIAEIIYTRLYHYLMDRVDGSDEMARRYHQMSQRGGGFPSPEMSERAGEFRDHGWMLMMVHGSSLLERGPGGGPGNGRGPGGLGGNRGGPDGPGGPRGSEKRRDPREPMLRSLVITDEELLGLMPYFDDETLATLDRITQAPTETMQRLAQVETLRYWCSETLRRKEPKEPDGLTDLERYREMKGRSDADFVDLMEPETFQQEMKGPRDSRRFFLERIFGRFPRPPR